MIRPTTVAARALVLTFVFGSCSPAALGAPATRPVVRGRVVAPPASRPAIAPELAPISLGWSLPFVLLLACIALMPFIARHFWERKYRNVSFGLALLVAVYYIFYRQDSMTWLREMKGYVSFIVLLGALFVVSGGISIRVNRKATPLANATLLLIGAALS